jgi:hypothetical protein
MFGAEFPALPHVYKWLYVYLEPREFRRVHMSRPSLSRSSIHIHPRHFGVDGPGRGMVS